MGLGGIPAPHGAGLGNKKPELHGEHPLLRPRGWRLPPLRGLWHAWLQVLLQPKFSARHPSPAVPEGRHGTGGLRVAVCPLQLVALLIPPSGAVEVLSGLGHSVPQFPQGVPQPTAPHPAGPAPKPLCTAAVAPSD